MYDNIREIRTRMTLLNAQAHSQWHGWSADYLTVAEQPQSRRLVELVISDVEVIGSGLQYVIVRQGIFRRFRHTGNRLPTSDNMHT